MIVSFCSSQAAGRGRSASRRLGRDGSDILGVSEDLKSLARVHHLRPRMVKVKTLRAGLACARTRVLENRMAERFFVRPDRNGFSVYDVWSGEVAVIAMAPQGGLSREDAEHTADLLNRRVAAGDRAVIQ